MVFEKFSLNTKSEQEPEELNLLSGHTPSTAHSRSHASEDGNEALSDLEDEDLPNLSQNLKSRRGRKKFQARRSFLSSFRIRAFQSRKLVCLISILSTIIILVICLVIFSRPISNRILPKKHSSVPYLIDWSDPPSPTRHWSNLYGLVSPAVGSKDWQKLYPTTKPSGPQPRPKWIERYNYLRSISDPTQPKTPLSSTWTTPQADLSTSNGLAQYPPDTKLNGDSDGACSYRRTSCLRGDREDHGMDMKDIWIGNNNTWSINFDDGPLPPSKSLYKFLDLHHEKATHFWIGSNVRDHPKLAIQAFKRGDHLAVHTWSHAHLTTLSDLEIIGELGWTMQIISDLTGVVPLYYRPPYGDVDNRVRALAKHVLGLVTLMWNCDSSDWTLNQTYAIGDFVDPPMSGFGLTQSINEINRHINSEDHLFGKIILEHELSEESVQAFQQTYSNVIKKGWKTCTVADCIESKWYQSTQKTM